MDVEEIWRKKCHFEGVCSITEGSKRGKDCQDPMGVSGLQGDIFLGFTSGICENNVDGN
jgi:hypothetical protein